MSVFSARQYTPQGRTGTVFSFTNVNLMPCAGPDIYTTHSISNFLNEVKGSREDILVFCLENNYFGYAHPILVWVHRCRRMSVPETAIATTGLQVLNATD